MNSHEIKGNSILLLGYGREGQSTHRYLLDNYPQAKISIADQKDVNPVYPVDNVFTGPDYLNHLSNFDTVIRSPGIPAHTKELMNFQKKGGWITSATNIFFSVAPGQTIGITGTKGKSTTSALIAHILTDSRNQSSPIPGISDVRLVGNIGNPMLDALNEASEQSIFVIELSSHQLEDVRFSPQIAVILNIVPEHLDYYKDFSAYQQSKSRIISFQNPADAVIFNPDHQTSKQIAESGKGDRLTFSTFAQKNCFSWIDKNKLFTTIRGKISEIIKVNEIPLLGNLENVLAAVTTGAFLEINADKIGKAIRTFKPLPHRLEPVGEFKGIKFYNDSLATTPEATIHALEALGENVETLIAGGFDRGLSYTELGVYLAHRKGLKNLILFPDTGQKIWEAIYRHSGPRAGIHFPANCNNDKDGSRVKPGMTNNKQRLIKYDVSSMEKAVQLAFKKTSPGKICLLSPASASYNLFRNYAERGELFKKYILSFRA